MIGWVGGSWESRRREHGEGGLGWVCKMRKIVLENKKNTYNYFLSVISLNIFLKKRNLSSCIGNMINL